MSLEKILKLKFNSKIARDVLSLFYKEGKFYSILTGDLKGLKSYYQSDVNFHAILGLWEKDSLVVLRRLIRNFDLDKKGLVIADVGANMGYYSMFFSRYLHPDSKIVAFEPSATIVNVLRKNIAENKAPNVEIVEQACTDQPGTVDFYLGEHHHQSSMLKEWAQNEVVNKKVTVPATSIDAFFGEKNGRQLPDLIKMDIEGGGVWALKGAQHCIKTKRPFILIESHTAEEDMAISGVLLQHNYEAFRIDTMKWVLNKDKDYHDPNGVHDTMLLIPAEKKAQFEKI